MVVDTDRLIEILERVQRKMKAFDEVVAFGCAIEAVIELDRIQLESKQSKKED